MATYSPIAVIGAGPSGLTLARLLEINNIDYMVYERDESPEPKFINQGGTLDIHASSGQVALKEAQLFDEFKSIARWDASRVFMQNPSGTVTAVFGDERDAPEIDRLQLRKLLLDSIPTGKIRWGHRVKSIERGDTASEHVISFVNSASASGFRAIVGADGVWSKVRPLVRQMTSRVVTYTNPSQAYFGETGVLWQSLHRGQHISQQSQLHRRTGTRRAREHARNGTAQDHGRSAASRRFLSILHGHGCAGRALSKTSGP